MNKIKLFACCIPVRGAKQSIICDVQRKTYKPVPNSMYEFITRYEGFAIADIKADFDEEDHETVDEYVAFLLKEEFAFLTDHPEYFPRLDTRWESPNFITNAVIDIKSASAHNYASIFGQLNHLRCLALELRFFDAFATADLEKILLFAENGTLNCIDIVFKFNDSSGKEKLKQIADTFHRVNHIFIHSTPHELVDGLNTDHNLIYTSQVITDQGHCGMINKLNFSVNQDLFFESQLFNSCLNRKIAIDSAGHIRNCPSMPRSFGHSNEVALSTVLQNPAFKQVWGITKDQVAICKDCEFRYICTDCRAYLKDPNDALSKPGKCSYDPYSATWG